MDPLYAYQDSSFEVSEVSGVVLRQLQLYVSNGSAEKFRGLLADGRRFQFYISAWLGFWSALDNEDYDAIAVDYDDCERIDYTAEHGLAGQTIDVAFCVRTSAGTEIQIQTALGTVRLFELHPEDPDSDCAAEFVPRP